MKYILILVLFLSIVGCSSKVISPSLEKNTTVMLEADEEDEFEDEFEETNKEVYDPLEGYNRWMTSVNDTLYMNVLNPIAKGYAFVLPQPARKGVSNVFHNLKFPLYFTNNVLQLKLDGSMRELARFMINSTIGVLGIFDVATSAGIKSAEEDFGQTLGYYGVGSGIPLVLPLLGPSNIRDTLGLTVDTLADPTSKGSLAYQKVDTTLDSVAIESVEMVNKVSLHLGEYENLKKDALDEYTFFRDSYEQHRNKVINK